MKKMIMLAIAALMLASTSAHAKPVWLAKGASVDAQPVIVDNNEFVRYTVRYQCAEDMWQDDVVNFCADKLREGCDRNLPIKFARTEGLTRTWDVPMEVVRNGQSGINFAKDENWFNTLWLGLPDGNLRVGSNLVCARSIADAGIPHSGGTYLLYVGPGAPYVPSANTLGIDGRPVTFACSGNVPVVREVPVVKVAPPKKDYPRKTVKRKGPCPDGKGICSQPCIVEIREGVEYLVKSVGMWTPDEPVEERTLQQKARITLDSLGKPDKTDEPDEKSVQQKTRKTLKHVKRIDKNVGEGKTGRSLHDKLGESKRKNGQLIPLTEEMHKDIKDIKAHLGIPAAKLNVCTNCHKP